VVSLGSRLRPVVAQAGGSAVLLSYPADLALTPEEVWGPARDGRSVRESIQRQFDPRGILNPGRFGY